MKWIILFPTIVLCILLAGDELWGQVEVRDSIAISRMLDSTGRSTQLMKSLGKVKGVVLPSATVVLPFDGKVRITIEGGASAAIDDVILRSPIEATIFYDANAHHGETWVSEQYPEGTVFDIGLYWHDWWSQSGSESDAYVEQVDDTTFVVFLEDIGMGDWDVILQVTMVSITPPPRLVILYPTANDANEHITSTPEMPNVRCRAQLENYNGGQVTFQWHYVVSNRFNRRTLEGGALCPRTGESTFEGNTVANSAEITTWTVPFLADNASFVFVGRNFRGNGCQERITTWTEGNSVFAGGGVTVRVTATTGDGTQYTAEVQANSIVGDNPTPGAVRNGIGLAEQVIVYKESYPRWNHFDNAGYPIYGPPNGFGLMQLDNPPATEFQLWSWRANRDAGVRILQDKLNDAIRYIAHVQRMNPEARALAGDELMIETAQRFNGGRYWRWVPYDPRDPANSAQWRGSTMPPLPGHTQSYGDEFWDIYTRVRDGNPPEGWN